MKIEVQVDIVGPVEFYSLEQGACFRAHSGAYYIKANPDPDRHGRATQVGSGSVVSFDGGTTVLPVEAKVVIGGDCDED